MSAKSQFDFEFGQKVLIKDEPEAVGVVVNYSCKKDNLVYVFLDTEAEPRPFKPDDLKPALPPKDVQTLIDALNADLWRIECSCSYHGGPRQECATCGTVLDDIKAALAPFAVDGAE